MSSVLTVLLALGTIIYTIYANQDKVRQLSIKQMIGVGLVFLVTIGFATICIYFGGNWIVSFIQNGIVKTVVQYAIIIIVLLTSVSTMYRVIHRLTNGVI